MRAYISVFIILILQCLYTHENQIKKVNKGKERTKNNSIVSF